MELLEDTQGQVLKEEQVNQDQSTTNFQYEQLYSSEPSNFVKGQEIASSKLLSEKLILRIKESIQKVVEELVQQTKKISLLSPQIMGEIAQFLQDHLDNLKSNKVYQFFSSNQAKAFALKKSLKEINNKSKKRFFTGIQNLKKLELNQIDFLQAEIKYVTDELRLNEKFSLSKINDIEISLEQFLKNVHSNSQLQQNSEDLISNFIRRLIIIIFAALGVTAVTGVASGVVTLGIGAVASMVVSDVSYRNTISNKIDEINNRKTVILKEANQKLSEFEQNLEMEVQKLLQKLSGSESEIGKEESSHKNANSSIAWLDKNVNNFENKNIQLQIKQLFPDMNHCFTVSKEDFIQFVNENTTVYVIISGSFGKKMIDEILLKFGIRSVIVFCFDTNLHKQWAMKFSKVSKVTSNIDEVFETINDQINQVEYVGGCNLFNFPNHLIKNSATYYLGQEFSVEDLPKIQQVDVRSIIQQTLNCYPEKAKNQLFGNILNQLKTLEEQIQKKFISIDQIINLYTLEGPFYKSLNTMLNTLNENAINSYSLIIQSVRYSLFNYDDKQSSLFQQKKFRLYRGINFDPALFQKSNRISDIFVFPAFTSTTSNIEVAKSFIKQHKLIIQIEFDCQEFGQQFEKFRPKNIQKLSIYKGEEEFLFPCFSTFQIIGYKVKKDYTIAKSKFIFLG